MQELKHIPRAPLWQASPVMTSVDTFPIVFGGIDAQPSATEAGVQVQFQGAPRYLTLDPRRGASSAWIRLAQAGWYPLSADRAVENNCNSGAEIRVYPAIEDRTSQVVLLGSDVPIAVPPANFRAVQAVLSSAASFSATTNSFLAFAVPTGTTELRFDVVLGGAVNGTLTVVAPVDGAGASFGAPSSFGTTLATLGLTAGSGSAGQNRLSLALTGAQDFVAFLYTRGTNGSTTCTIRVYGGST